MRANRHDDFYIRPAGGVDLCNVQVPVAEEGLASGRPGVVVLVAVLVLDDRPGALCERMLASASGSAVAQKAHSAEIRPMIQCVRPQPGQ